MKAFLQRFGDAMIGVLSGFDRLRLRGTKRFLAHAAGMMGFLWQLKIPLKDFGAYAEDTTKTLRNSVEQAAQQAGRPLVYLPGDSERKRDRARTIAQADGIREGLICVLSCVEPCRSYGVLRNRATHKLELQLSERKCLYYYHYYNHPQLGFLHARLQTWFPFTFEICLNGREWLARQMDEAGLTYARRDNCFLAVEDVAAAQTLLDQQLRVNWPELLEPLAAASNPAHDRIFSRATVPYYWTVAESEWATDFLFRSAGDLAAWYPRLLQHGIQTLGSRDVLRFLGQKVTAKGEIHPWFTGEVVTNLKQRPEGLRIKHRLNRNWIKMYDKQGSVLRVETVINDPRDMMVYRAKEGDPDGPKQWRRMRQGVADVQRRAELSQKANERYADSLATVADTAPLGEVSQTLCKPVRWKGRRIRALNPLSQPDGQLLQTIYRGEFLLHGFRNRDVRVLLYSDDATDPNEARRRSAAVTRKFRILRAHGLIEKLPHTQRYRVSEKGRHTIAALLAARAADTAKLTNAA